MSLTDPTPVPSPAPIAPPAAATRRGVSTTALLVVSGFLAVAGIAFAGGRLTAPALGASAAANQLFGAGAAGTAGRRQQGVGGFGAELRGKVTAVASDHLTVQLDNGRSVDVLTDASTTYHRQAAASAADVTSGSNVLIGVAAATPGSQPSQGQRTLRATDVTVGAP